MFSTLKAETGAANTHVARDKDLDGSCLAEESKPIHRRDDSVHLDTVNTILSDEFHKH